MDKDQSKIISQKHSDYIKISSTKFGFYSLLYIQNSGRNKLYISPAKKIPAKKET